ncbi:SNF2 family N-terminal domain-containing protein [Apiospora phragmitis]|uniref:SNF2 family N-terminal domain-containing protein n=1 Tax=Apiospora phragmitis TaxID=2905665 RepID=A0ABR1T7F3_9PEZI
MLAGADGRPIICTVPSRAQGPGDLEPVSEYGVPRVFPEPFRFSTPSNLPIDLEVVNPANRVTGPEGKTMWRARFQHGGTTRYHNIVTGGQRLARPSVAKGGLLADEIGLGKTLTALSLIASDKGPGRRTLILAPPSVMQEWQNQIGLHIAKVHATGEPILRFAIYYGPNRTQERGDLQNFDIVLSTYHTLSKEWQDSQRAEGNPKPPPLLHDMRWRRLILDEANLIKNYKTKLYQAVDALAPKADRRWLLTATPLNNGPDNLAAIFGILRTSRFDTAEKFIQQINNPVRQNIKDAEKRVPQIISCHTLRRTKEGVSINTKPKTLHNIQVELAPEDVPDYRRLESKLYQFVREVETTLPFIQKLSVLRYMLAVGFKNYTRQEGNSADDVVLARDALCGLGIELHPVELPAADHILAQATDNDGMLSCLACAKQQPFKQRYVRLDAA